MASRLSVTNALCLNFFRALENAAAVTSVRETRRPNSSLKKPSSSRWIDPSSILPMYGEDVSATTEGSGG